MPAFQRAWSSVYTQLQKVEYLLSQHTHVGYVTRMTYIIFSMQQNDSKGELKKCLETVNVDNFSSTVCASCL